MKSKDQQLLEEQYELVSEAFYSNDNADDMAELIGQLLVKQEVYDVWKNSKTKLKANLRVKYQYGENEFDITIVQTKAPSKKTLEQNRKKGLYTM